MAALYRERCALLAVTFLCVVGLCALSGCAETIATPPISSGRTIAFGGGEAGSRDACFTCHGFAGEGDDRAPRLAGLSAGYIGKQLADYANGARVDTVMGPIAKRLQDHEKRAVALFYSGLPQAQRGERTAPLIFAQGDAARGVTACVKCHGESGAGAGQANPAIHGQPRAYTLEQLQRYKRSTRRNDPRDVMGAASRPLTPAEIEALADYLSP